MLVLTGPPGSGKSYCILEDVRAALRRGDTDFRLLVPTATMAEHLRNRMVREGFAVRPSFITTLTRFVEDWVADTPEITAVQLDLIVDAVLARACPPEFKAASGRKGFRRLLAGLIDELSSAGHDSRRLAKLVGPKPEDAPLAPAFLSVYEEVEKEVCQQRGMLRPARIRRAADEIRARGLGRVHRVYLDGFFTFSRPELHLVHALRSCADVTIALPGWSGAAPALAALDAMGMERRELAASVRRFPIRHVVKAANAEQEANDVARRILEHAANGRQFRDIGIVLRGRDPYVPLLQATLERYGIPARFHFATPLSGHAVVRYLTGAIEAMLGGWDHEALLPLLKMPVCGFGATPACDRFDFAVREQLPNRGLAALRRLSDDPRLGALLDRLGAAERWAAARVVPADWAFRIKTLRCLMQPPPPSDGVPHATAALWRGEARALEAFSAALDEAAAALPANAPVSFADYWNVLGCVLDHAELRVRDDRRNVVNVIDVYEARQWELPVVFVCGLIEKQFPRYHAPDPVFPDSLRERLQTAAVSLKTGADLRAEEQFLFEIAASRATSELVLTWPEHNEKGDPNLPSFFLDSLEVETAPLPDGIPSSSGPRPSGGGAVPYLKDPALLEIVAERHEVIRPSAIEAFLQCPFQFFLAHTLELQTPPPLPRDRLDARVVGSIVHQTLAEWHRGAESIEAVFERVFRDVCRRECVPEGCRTELARIQSLRDLRRFIARARRPEGWRIVTEEEIEFDLDDETAIRGRIDRYDVSPDNRVAVFDYKYSRAESIRKRIRNYAEGRAVQGALYLLGLEKLHGYTPAGLFYCGLKKDVTLDGWHVALDEFGGGGASCTPAVLREQLDRAREATLAAAREIRRGRVEPWPSSREACDYCGFLDVCRIGPPAEAVAAEGGGE